MSTTTTPIPIPVSFGGALVSEGNVITQIPLAASASYQSPLYRVDRPDGVVLARAESNQSGTLYVIFTDSSGEYVISVQPSGGLATGSTSAPSGSTGLTGVQSAVIRTNFNSRYFYIFFTNGSTLETQLEIEWRAQNC